MDIFAEQLAEKYGYSKVQCNNQWTLSYTTCIPGQSKPFRINVFFSKRKVAICDPCTKSQQFRQNVSNQELEQIFAAHSNSHLNMKSDMKQDSQSENEHDDDYDDEEEEDEEDDDDINILNGTNKEKETQKNLSPFVSNTYQRRMYILYAKYGATCNLCGSQGHWSFECRAHPQYKQIRQQVLKCHPTANI